MKIVTIVGTRPNLIKEYALQREMSQHGVDEILIHTGQHYDYLMSDVFFEELKIRRPKYVNNIIKGSHAQETANMMLFIEEVLLNEKPDLTLVYGDVNSTLAASIASKKIKIPVAHVEAGIRSLNTFNPEEINRRVADVLSDVLFPATQSAYDNLRAEGYPELAVHMVGDLMYDALLLATADHEIMVTQRNYTLATVHRAENADDPEKLRAIIHCFEKSPIPVRWVLHPRTEKNLKSFDLWGRINDCPNISLSPPLGFVDFLREMAGADIVVTDSGGVRREAYMLGKPSILLIDIVWFPELTESGWSRIILPENTEAVVQALGTFRPSSDRPPHFGDGSAAKKITRHLLEKYGNK